MGKMLANVMMIEICVSTRDEYNIHISCTLMLSYTREQNTPKARMLGFSSFTESEQFMSSDKSSSIYNESDASVSSNVAVFFLLFGAIVALAFGISYFQKQG